ncbi:hypothetical protein [Frigoriglobus tundricola]|uniref:Restriction endonuclease domain-containing protein n=1 Tax=Frigoriglobus tundricola TaxID=2774151 RepID=A0A6M5YUS9_9BACT|nr:hypothetical protein [Frigoriglobus tundricola]QJW97194.1 hypothetical protein FTUN_4759 [Frigoriglobus tundricola]
MPTIGTARYGAVSIPSGIADLAAFRRWVHSADLPEKLPIHFPRGGVWVDCERADRIRFSNGGNPNAQATEVIGTPDIVIEIVSDASEERTRIG